MRVPPPLSDLQRKKKEYPILATEPTFYSPLTDFFATPLHNQYDIFCRDFELQLAQCVEAYGFFQGQMKCEPLIRDMSECLMANKRNSRYEIIRGEFQRQINAGERKYEKTKFFSFIEQ